MFENTDLAFIRLLCTKVKPAHFHASEYIVRKGDIGQEMFIIRKGLVRKLSRDIEHYNIQGGKTFCASFCASLIAGSRRAFLCVDGVDRVRLCLFVD